ncbi:MAG: RnfH family protein [Thiopseudomonas sp.]|nr:RnfH family protein [Thiopseudomonas sp.]MCK9465988.1 RnfH family protein [Thiopseudomonas sp.]
MDKAMINVEVAYALADKQKINSLRVPRGTTVRQAALQSGLDRIFPDLDLANSPLGVFSKGIAKPDEHELQNGDRVEIYRPLLADPKEARKKRAEKAAQAKES